MDSCEQDIQMHVTKIGHVPLLSTKDEDALAERVRRGDRKARSRLILGGLRLVAAVVRKHRLPEPCVLALISSGQRALANAVDRFDAASGVSFRAFALPLVQQAVQQVVDETGTAALPPGHCIRDSQALLSRLGAKAPRSPARKSAPRGVAAHSTKPETRNVNR